MYNKGGSLIILYYEYVMAFDKNVAEKDLWRKVRVSRKTLDVHSS